MGPGPNRVSLVVLCRARCHPSLGPAWTFTLKILNVGSPACYSSRSLLLELEAHPDPTQIFHNRLLTQLGDLTPMLCPCMPCPLLFVDCPNPPIDLPYPYNRQILTSHLESDHCLNTCWGDAATTPPQRNCSGLYSRSPAAWY